MRLSALLGLVSMSAAPFLVAGAIAPEEATEAGIQYFQERCADQQALMVPLIAAIEAGDLQTSIPAYGDARPPYEEIETLANSFSDIDADIDARPYAFEYGEDSEEFRGFHRIERDLYRDGDVAAAEEHVLVLNNSVNALCETLADMSNFSPKKSWDGFMALAYELPAKKISSEEEAWSDLSLMIFRHNFKGIWSQFQPFLDVEGVKAEDAQAAQDVYDGLKATMEKIDPENGFEGANGGFSARPYSDVSIPERDEILEGAYKFAQALATVRESLTFDEADEAEEEEEESSPVVDSSMYESETAEGIEYFAGLCKDQQALVAELETVLATGDLEASKDAYRKARPPYEQIETLAGDFEEEDTNIDARPYAFETGELSEDFVGFHKIERQLYRDDDVEGALEAIPALKDAVDSLCAKLDEGEGFTADSTWGGVLALVYEVPAKKISSEEETWSDLSLMIFRENAKGINSQYAPFAGAISESTAAEVTATYEDLKAYLESVDSGNTWEGTDFRAYSDVSTEERKGISDRFYTYAGTLIAARGELEQAPEPSGEAEEEEEEEEEAACFPAHATVELSNGIHKRMDQLQVGDDVRVGEKEFSTVFMFTHNSQDHLSRFVKITGTDGEQLELSPLHYLYVNDELVKARDVKVGDSLRGSNGEAVSVSSVEIEMMNGLYNPQTVHGDIVVNGIVSSTYTATIEPAVAHTLLAPLRLVHALTGWYTSVLE